MEATLMFISLFGPNLAAKLPGMTKGEQGVKNPFKGMNLFWTFETAVLQKDRYELAKRSVLLVQKQNLPVT